MKKLILLFLLSFSLVGCKTNEYETYEITELVYVNEVKESGIFTTKVNNQEFVEVFYTVDGKTELFKEYKRHVKIDNESYVELTETGVIYINLTQEDYIEVFGN